MLGHVRRSIYSKRFGRGYNQYGSDGDWGVLDGMHIGATCRIRLNRPCAAGILMLNYLDHLGVGVERKEKLESPHLRCHRPREQYFPPVIVNFDL